MRLSGGLVSVSDDSRQIMIGIDLISYTRREPNSDIRSRFDCSFGGCANWPQHDFVSVLDPPGRAEAVLFL